MQSEKFWLVEEIFRLMYGSPPSIYIHNSLSKVKDFLHVLKALNYHRALSFFEEKFILMFENVLQLGHYLDVGIQMKLPTTIDFCLRFSAM